LLICTAATIMIVCACVSAVPVCTVDAQSFVEHAANDCFQHFFNDTNSEGMASYTYMRTSKMKYLISDTYLIT